MHSENHENTLEKIKHEVKSCFQLFIITFFFCNYKVISVVISYLVKKQKNGRACTTLEDVQETSMPFGQYV